jgi:glucose-6-phosphate 1-dehydrogenase
MTQTSVKAISPPTVLIALGATGDLMSKKIFPALHALYQENLLPSKFKLLGLSRRPWSNQDFRKHLSALIKNPSPSFIKKSFFHSGDFDQPQTYTSLYQALRKIDQKWGTCSNKLFYLAVPPVFYQNILRHLKDSGLTRTCSTKEGWTRIIIEKPFGQDALSASRLDDSLGRLFNEKQIFRVDHYLAKNIMQNILFFRFSNNLLEKNWDKNSIEKIEITLNETQDVSHRGHYYDPIGALRDVGQNHLLQMLAVLTMDQPASLSDQDIRKQRALLLEKLEILTPLKIKTQTTHGQYRGYHQSAGVEPKSKTETAFKITTTLNSARWKTVPIILKSAKKVKKDQKEITVYFKHSQPCLCPNPPHYQNKITFSILEEKIYIQFWVKSPDSKDKLKSQNFVYDFSSDLPARSDYSQLLLDCFLGDQTLFVSTDELKASWKFIDPVLKSWARNQPSLRIYSPGSDF